MGILIVDDAYGLDMHWMYLQHFPPQLQGIDLSWFLKDTNLDLLV